jgi:hypothetical protein
MPRHKPISRATRKTRARITRRRQKSRLRGFAAINRVRRGKAKSLSAAARAEGTTVRTIGRLLPAALVKRRRGGRVRVRASDPYSERVEILTDLGPLDVTARGSRERELAGRHRSVYLKVLRGDLPASALDEFRGKTVGGHRLISDPDLLFTLAKGGELEQLDTLYVSLETRG